MGITPPDVDAGEAEKRSDEKRGIVPICHPPVPRDKPKKTQEYAHTRRLNLTTTPVLTKAAASRILTTASPSPTTRPPRNKSRWRIFGGAPSTNVAPRPGPGSCAIYQRRLAGHDQVPDSRPEKKGACVASTQPITLQTVWLLRVDTKTVRVYVFAFALALPKATWS
jgi:hypothetical protein